jgi:FtsH-binding integral membrane protein
MIKLNRKFIILILVILFFHSFINLITKSEENGTIYSLLGYILFFDVSRIDIYDYIFAGSAVLGAILQFANIFYNNYFMTNVYSLLICGLLIVFYVKKTGV